VEAPGIEPALRQWPNPIEHQNGSIGTHVDPAIVPTSAPKCAIERRVRTESSEPFRAESERAAALAELVLRACALGAPCDDLAIALANAVVDAAGARLAVDVLAGSEHRFARATELAGRVLDAVRGDARGREHAHG